MVHEIPFRVTLRRCNAKFTVTAVDSAKRGVQFYADSFGPKLGTLLPVLNPLTLLSPRAEVVYVKARRAPTATAAVKESLYEQFLFSAYRFFFGCDGPLYLQWPGRSYPKHGSKPRSGCEAVRLHRYWRRKLWIRVCQSHLQS